jgi:hypothetical protein
MKVKIKNIKPNPFRKIERYPIREEKVQALIKSFEATGIWPVILGRQVGSYIEIPFGHHRKAAWERLFKPNDEIEITPQVLSDTDMLKMMAHENMEEWGTSAIVEIETIAAVVEAYAEGKIELNGLPKDTRKSAIRYAPSYVSGRLQESCDRPYTLNSVASFLGWVYDNGKPFNKVGTSLAALQLIEEGILTTDHFEGLKTTQAEELVKETRARKEQREAEAKESEVRRQQAEKRARDAETYQARKVAEEQEAYHAEQAEKKRRKGKEEATRVGAHLSRGIKAGKIALQDVASEADKQVGLDRKERKLRNINSAVRNVIKKLDQLLDSDNLTFQLRALAQDVDHIDVGLAETLMDSFDSLIKRAESFRTRFAPRSELKNVTTTKKLLTDG